jgi:hypothetical protein
VVNSGVEGADEREVTKVMSAIADRVVHEFVEPFVFPNHHHRILEPYNYYEFGQVRDFNGKFRQHSWWTLNSRSFIMDFSLPGGLNV